MYCEGCKRLYSGGTRCPSCRRPGREPLPEDLVVVCDRPVLLAEMLSDILRSEGIENIKQGILGAGLSSILGMHAEKVSILVPFALLEQAREIEEAFFAGNYPEEARETLPEE